MEQSSSTPAPKNSEAEHWTRFLEMAVSLSRAAGGAIWEVQEGQAILLAQHQLGNERLDAVHQQWPGHVESLQKVIQTGQSQSLEAKFEQSTGSNALRLLLFPILSGQSVLKLLELFLPAQSELTEAEVESCVQQLLVWGTPANDSQTSSHAIHFASWLAHLHQHLDVEGTSFTITNETRLWSGWDRISLLVTEGKQLRLKSVSGVDTLDPRSTTVSTLEGLARNSQDHFQRAIFSNSNDPSELLAAYHERTLAKHVAIIPLTGGVPPKERSLLGLLICDRFEEGEQEVQSFEDLQIAGHHISKALEHALRFEDANLGPVQRFIRRVFSVPVAKRQALVSVFASILFLLCVWPATLTVTGTGFLEPEQKRDVFAGSNGFIHQLSVTQGSLVQTGDQLLSLRSPELELELNRTQGELATVRQQIDDLEKIRSDPRRANESQRSSAELAARGEELKTVEIGLVKQIALLNLQSKELILKSPLEGEVVTSHLEAVLSENRPVVRTDRLLSIADLSGNWKARLHVDHRDLGPVLNAYRKKTASVTFLTEDAVDSPKSATLQSVAPMVTTDAISGSTLVFDALVKRAVIPKAKPGTTILFRIDCGKAPVGYVWFRRLIDRVRGWWSLL